MNLYRVDRASSPSTPVGMNSICYIGDSFPKAVGAFHAHKPGFNPWDQPDPAYGIILSVWSDLSQSYIVRNQKWTDNLLFIESAGDLYGPFHSFQTAKDFARQKALAPFQILSLSERHLLLPATKALRPTQI